MKNNIPDYISDSIFFVGLGSCRDYSRFSSLSRSAQLHETCKIEGLVYFQVSSLKEARKLVLEFIEDANLTSSNWTGGNIYDENMNFKATVSYNGRVWDNIDWKKSKEIILC